MQATKQLSDIEKNSSENVNSTSFCDIMKDNISEIVKKMELQIPSYIQLYSDFYKEYLHSLDNVFGTCYLAEKEFFDNIGFDQNALKALEDYSSFFTKVLSTNMELSTNILKVYIQGRILAMKNYDGMTHQLMDNYGIMLAGLNSWLKKH